MESEFLLGSGYQLEWEYRLESRCVLELEFVRQWRSW